MHSKKIKKVENFFTLINVHNFVNFSPSCNACLGKFSFIFVLRQGCSTLMILKML